MNKQQAIKILKMQRDSYLYDSKVASHRNDFVEWCKDKAREFDDVIEWVEKEVVE